MDNTLQFQQNASVCAVSGDEVGRVSRIVVRPETNAVTNIVVRTKALLKKEERVVPIDQVAEANENQVILNRSADEMESLPLFEEKHFAPVDEAVDLYTPPIQPTMGGVPAPISTAVSSRGDKYITKVEQNIPSGTIAVKEGAKVMTSEGKVVGKMESMLADAPADHQVTHLLVSKGLLTEEKKLVPINWVETLGEEEIKLNVEEYSVQELESISTE